MVETSAAGPEKNLPPAKSDSRRHKCFGVMRFDKGMKDAHRSPRCSGVLVTITSHAAEEAALAASKDRDCKRYNRPQPKLMKTGEPTQYDNWYCSCTGYSEWRDAGAATAGKAVDGKTPGGAAANDITSDAGLRLGGAIAPPVCHLGVFHTAVTKSVAGSTTAMERREQNALRLGKHLGGIGGPGSFGPTGPEIPPVGTDDVVRGADKPANAAATAHTTLDQPREWLSWLSRAAESPSPPSATETMEVAKAQLVAVYEFGERIAALQYKAGLKLYNHNWLLTSERLYLATQKTGEKHCNFFAVFYAVFFVPSVSMSNAARYWLCHGSIERQDPLSNDRFLQTIQLTCVPQIGGRIADGFVRHGTQMSGLIVKEIEQLGENLATIFGRK